MVLNNYRTQADFFLHPLAQLLKGISPNTFTYLSIIFAIMTGYFYYLTNYSDSYLLLAFILLFLSSLFDALDGWVARLTDNTSIKGDFLDHVFDRYSDIFILGGITFSPYCPVEIGFIATISVIMVSYLGTQAEAELGIRNYGSWLGRADRLTLLIFASIFQYILTAFFSIYEILSFYVLGWLMIFFIIIGNISAFQRFQDTLEKISDEDTGYLGMNPEHARPEWLLLKTLRNHTPR